MVMTVSAWPLACSVLLYYREEDFLRELLREREAVFLAEVLPEAVDFFLADFVREEPEVFAALFFGALFFAAFFFAGALGTLLPCFRASDSPMAIACFRLVTFFPLLPLFNLPSFISSIARFTFCWLPFEYLAIKIIFVIVSCFNLFASGALKQQARCTGQ
jgi:hypothetical protein